MDWLALYSNERGFEDRLAEVFNASCSHFSNNACHMTIWEWFCQWMEEIKQSPCAWSEKALGAWKLDQTMFPDKDSQHWHCTWDGETVVSGKAGCTLMFESCGDVNITVQRPTRYHEAATALSVDMFEGFVGSVHSSVHTLALCNKNGFCNGSFLGAIQRNAQHDNLSFQSKYPNTTVFRKESACVRCKNRGLPEPLDLGWTSWGSKKASTIRSLINNL